MRCVKFVLWFGDYPFVTVVEICKLFRELTSFQISLAHFRANKDKKIITESQGREPRICHDWSGVNPNRLLCNVFNGLRRPQFFKLEECERWLYVLAWTQNDDVAIIMWFLYNFAALCGLKTFDAFPELCGRKRSDTYSEWKCCFQISRRCKGGTRWYFYSAEHRF